MTPRARRLVAAAFFGGLLVALYLVAVRTAEGQFVDVRLFGLAQTGEGTLETVAGGLRRGLPVALAVCCAALAIPAVRHRRWWDVVAAAVVVGVSYPLSDLLQGLVLDRPYLGDHGYTQNTLPSGHVTVVASLGVAAVLLAPRRHRVPWALLVGLVAAVACAASVLGHAHRPSDVLASLLLVATVTYATTGLLPSGIGDRVGNGRHGRVDRARAR